MSSAGQRPRRSKGGGEPRQASNLLDAYVDTKSSTKVTEDLKPVSTKNKNKKKREQREAEEKRRQSESIAAEDDEVVDSWEDISAADAPQLPKNAIKVETPAKKVELPPEIGDSTKTSDASVEESLSESMSKLSISKPTPVGSATKQKLIALKTTMKEIEEFFKTGSNTEAEVLKSDSSADVPAEENSREQIKAEREALKKAKAAAKQARKNKADPTDGNKTVPEKVNEVPEEVSKVEKVPVKEDEVSKEAFKTEMTREEIKAEREAKKAAKAAAKAGGNKEMKSAEKPPEGGKSKAELKAERRAKQEAQRAAKEMQKQQQTNSGSNKKDDVIKAAPTAAKPSAAPTVVTPSTKPSSNKVQRVSDDIQADRPSVEKKKQRMLAAQQIQTRTKAQKQVQLFKHLYQYERALSVTRGYPIVGAHIHPAILQLGLQYSEGMIQGSNARCVAFLYTLKKIILEHVTPPDRDFSREMDAKMKLYVSFLKECRPHSVSVGSAIRSIKAKITSMKAGISDVDGKAALCDTIDLFCDNIKLAPKSIAKTACQKIKNGDVILTYGCSSLLKYVLVEAFNSGLQFRVVVADARPKLEGREMVRHLVNAGIECTYLHISAVAHIIKQVNKVFLGAHAVLANGFVMSRVGTAQVALIAKSNNVPVMVCCETYKFSERVQTDSFVFNELGDPDDLVATGRQVNPLEDWRDLKQLFLLNLTYDFTPANLVDAIVSEISVIPCTSVPVVLRLKKDDLS